MINKILGRTKRFVSKRASLLRAMTGGTVSEQLAQETLLNGLRRNSETLGRSDEEVEIAYRMHHMLRAREDEIRGNRWLHYRWTDIVGELFEDIGGVAQVPENFNYVCVGAGDRNPLTLPLLLFMAGAGKVHVNEPVVVRETDAWRSIWGLQEAVLRLLSGDIKSKYFVRSTDQLNEFLDIQALFYTDDIPQILNSDNVSLSNVGFESAPIDDNSVDLLSSRSVLEHIVDYENFFDNFARIMKPKGIMYHDVDFSSHSKKDTFEFYYQSPEKARRHPGFPLNELRLSDYLAKLEERGFENTVMRTQIREDYALDSARLEPRFRSYSQEDLISQRAVIVSRKL